MTGSEGKKRLTRLCSATGMPFPFMNKGKDIRNKHVRLDCCMILIITPIVEDLFEKTKIVWNF